MAGNFNCKVVDSPLRYPDIVGVLRVMWIERRLRGTGAFIMPNGSRLPIGPFRIEQNGSVANAVEVV